MKNCLTISHFFISFLCCLSAFAISDDAVIDWGSPIVEAGRTGCVYPIKYTKTEPADNSWQLRSFDDSMWTDGL